MDFTIDEYEKSTKEFEKYVNTIPKKVPLKLTKSNTISSLVKEYYQKSEYTDTEELVMLSEILSSLQNWGNTSAKRTPSSNTSQIVMLCTQHKDLTKRLENSNQEIESLKELIEFKINEANGFTSQIEINEVISVLNSKIGKLGSKHKETEKIVLQIQELKNLVPEVKLIEEMSANVERLESERESIIRNLNKITENYEEIIARQKD